uniref:FAD-dependent monooxygenase n=1 Tax=Pyrenophora dematioidea TaxID=139229 RepID=LAN4_PYRDE
MYDVIVVGAGWCGLAAAKTYLQTCPTARLLVVDGDSSIGGTWSKERLYPHLVAEAHYGLFEFSDLPMRREGILPDGRIPSAAVHAYLTEYATKFGLLPRIRLNTWIEDIRQDPTAIGDDKAPYWTLQVAGSSQPLQARKLIIATGLTSEPRMPSFPGREDFEGHVLHSKMMGRADTGKLLNDPSIRHVVVYGGSKSAFDAVYLLLRAGKTVDWVIREGGGGPSIMTPLNILGQPSFRLNNSRVMSLFSPNPFEVAGERSWWQRVMHQRAGTFAQLLVVWFWRVLAYLLQRPWKYDYSVNGKQLKPILGLDSVLWSPATLGVMTHPTLWEDIHSGERVTIRRQNITALGQNKHVVLSNGDRITADMVVCATGWHARHSLFTPDEQLAVGLPSTSSFDPKSQAHWLNLQKAADEEILEEFPLLQNCPIALPPVRCEDDHHLYRFVAPSSGPLAQERLIAYVGFLRTTGAPIVYEAQSLWATAYLTGALHVPALEEREKEVARTNAWIRRRYICGRKVPFALFDFLPYVDMLYRDLGVNSRRKKNAVSE